MQPPTVRRRFLAVLAVVLGLAIPAAASAHPLGNFTVNHYAALRVEGARIALDVVVDVAEIPAFQERVRIDADGDGNVTDSEADAARDDECRALLPSLELRVEGARVVPVLIAAGLSFPAGAGGVPTMRTVCQLEVALGEALRDGAVVTFTDTSSPERIGWREIVVIGDGRAIAGVDGAAPPTAEDVSHRLTAYPESLLQQPLDVRALAFTVAGTAPALAPFVAPDAAPLAGAAPDPTAPDPAATPPAGGPIAAPSPAASSPAAAIPGGVGGDIPDLFRVADLTPLVAAGSILLAMALGAGHALTPGHGKTLMAAYLVGTRGTIRHAAGLGIAVTVSHTLGILLLALLVTGAEAALPAEVVVRTVPVIAALTFVAIGAWMVAGEVRRRRASRMPRVPGVSAHDHVDDGQAEGHGHAHEHEHGGIRHSHLPAGDRPISWRSLSALGLAGGIIPSTNALVILLGTVVAGRAAFGVVLVVAFGLGMALVLGGVGALMVVARDRLERLPSSSTLGRVAAQAPLLASVVVLGIGLWLSAQAVGGGTAL